MQHPIECVVHFAALKAVGESCRLPLTYYQNNITGTSVLLETMAANNVHKIVYSSSATVYGEPEFLPLTELHSTGKCTNPYGKSKFFTEEILKDLCESDKVGHGHDNSHSGHCLLTSVCPLEMVGDLVAIL